MRAIDLNCDLGEGAGHDAELMPLITSANIACGGHAGDGTTMRATLRLALQHGVAIGAHPGFPDREHFGRREISAEPERVYHWVKEQAARLIELATEVGARVRHVKPHGALYNLAARNAALADAVAHAVRDCGEHLVLVGLAESELPRAGLRAGLRVAHEIFADRAYHQDGSLVARSDARALLSNAEEAAARLIGVLRTGKVPSIEGVDIALHADTICLHGDGPEAVRFAQELRRALGAAGGAIAPLSV